MIRQKWTNLKRQDISQLLESEGKAVSVTVIDQLLKKHNYRKRKAQKRFATDETLNLRSPNSESYLIHDP